MHGSPELRLAELQARIGAALLADDPEKQRLPEQWFTGAHAGAVGLRVHRNTVLGALSHALRLSFASIDRLVGEEFFDRMAVAYARAAPPRAPQLDAWGDAFPDFIDGFSGTGALPFLAELARFDWQLDELGRLPAGGGSGATIVLEGGARLHFAATLRLHRSTYAVERLRAALLIDTEADAAEALAGAVAQRADCHYALWRSDAGVSVRARSAPAASFIAAVLAGAEADAALAAAANGRGDDDVVTLLAQEILPAGFVSIDAGAAGA